MSDLPRTAREKFSIGDRVIQTDVPVTVQDGRVKKLGIVVGFGMPRLGNEQIVHVKHDGRKSYESWHMSCWEKLGP